LANGGAGPARAKAVTGHRTPRSCRNVAKKED